MSAPIITADLEASSGNKWTVPVGGGVGKLFKLDKLPINTQLQAFSNVERPQFAADWQLRFQLLFSSQISWLTCFTNPTLIRHGRLNSALM